MSAFESNIAEVFALILRTKASILNLDNSNSIHHLNISFSNDNDPDISKSEVRCLEEAIWDSKLKLLTIKYNPQGHSGLVQRRMELLKQISKN